MMHAVASETRGDKFPAHLVSNREALRIPRGMAASLLFIREKWPGALERYRIAVSLRLKSGGQEPQRWCSQRNLRLPSKRPTRDARISNCAQKFAIPDRGRGREDSDFENWNALRSADPYLDHPLHGHPEARPDSIDFRSRGFQFREVVPGRDAPQLLWRIPA